MTLTATIVFIAAVVAWFPADGIIAVPAQKGDLQLTSAAFKDREPIPVQYTCDGKNISPPLSWSDSPDKTKSFVLIVDDPDAPRGVWVHWIIYNLPASAAGLAEDAKTSSLPGEAKQMTNDFRLPGYGGPCPPHGKPHRYFFRLFALDATLDLKPAATRKDLEDAMAKHILAQTQLMGIYRRK
jgi:Raf kinase inhibitor-like YbhB/YbcL family protein